MLRSCAQCGSDLPAKATARAKFCSDACRVRAHRGRTGAPDLVVVGAGALPPGAPTVRPVSDSTVPVGRLAALREHEARLARLLAESDPRTAAPLSKEYRETLKEIETLVEAEGREGQHRGGSRRAGRSFDASAV